MNKNGKRWLALIIVLQFVLLVFPVGASLTKESLREKAIMENGKEFLFPVSSLSVHRGELYLTAHVRKVIDGGNVQRNEKLELYVDENGEVCAKKHEGETDWYTEGDYFGKVISLENIEFRDGWDAERIQSIVGYRQNVVHWYFGRGYEGEYDRDYFYEAKFTATVYRGEIEVHTLYIDGEEVLNVTK